MCSYIQLLQSEYSMGLAGRGIRLSDDGGGQVHGVESTSGQSAPPAAAPASCCCLAPALHLLLLLPPAAALLLLLHLLSSAASPPAARCVAAPASCSNWSWSSLSLLLCLSGPAAPAPTSCLLGGLPPAHDSCSLQGPHPVTPVSQPAVVLLLAGRSPQGPRSQAGFCQAIPIQGPGRELQLNL